MLPEYLSGLFTDGFKSIKVAEVKMIPWISETELDVLAGLLKTPGLQTVLDHASDFSSMSRDAIKISAGTQKANIHVDEAVPAAIAHASRCLKLEL